MRARLRDTEIFFDIEGAGLVAADGAMIERPTAFVIHGGPGADHSGLKSRYGGLARKAQLVYFDHRGQGRSARGDISRYTLDENVEDMEALRGHLGLGPIVSIGTSYGGIVAMAHAARYPASVSHLVLVATAAHKGMLVRAKEIIRERGTAEQLQLFEDVLAGRFSSQDHMLHYFEVMAPLFSRRVIPSLFADGLKRAILSPEAQNRAFGPGGCLRDFDLRTELSRIVAPTLILAGRYDWICAPEFSEEIHRLIPGSDLRIFEGSSHNIAGDEPQELLDVIAGFLVYKAKVPASESSAAQ